jgi:predicted PurR-regulated permease PerM
MGNRLSNRLKSWLERKVNKLNNKGMGTVEIILIIVVLVGLVIIFKTQILELITAVFDKISADSSTIMA